MITVDFKRLDVRPGFRILDIGCGSGRHTGAAARIRDVRVVGTDICFDDLNEARGRLNLLESWGEIRGRWNLAATDITTLPFGESAFDLVICSEVLEHIPDQHRAISEIIRVLKPGCNLVVSVPRYLPERICWALSESYRNTPGGHIRIYRKKALTRLLESRGVKKWGFHWAHSLHTPYWWLKCLVGPDRKDSLPVNLYHRLLVWDMMARPRLTRLAEKLLNPFMGKSIVLYLKKESA
ncbi:SAM-dependent methyltransferase [Desulfonema ishimotonii]|uniref:SAM-dependent methyltransferase n=1 Tax=Desulfonema ishimotonii TaxID=45657 RepID=A0A401FS03_9BACT|nr:class I SAM-dependent methyltransferase [Desulfonema ishimotonii]GBC59733.1 SAM-dependent methyltransferase [Desulfonema ishimotonii]